MSAPAWRRPLAAAAALLGLFPGIAPAQPPDAARGRALYENHCMACHTPKVHGRSQPRAIDLEALRFIVRVWAEENRLPWGEQEIEDVVEHLDRTHYRFQR